MSKAVYRPGELRKLKRVKVFVLEPGMEKAQVRELAGEFAVIQHGQVYTGIHIDKAIQLLEDPDRYLALVLEDDQLLAIQLGMLALKVFRKERSKGNVFSFPLLLGETTESGQ